MTNPATFATEADRQHFEQEVFKRYFIAHIGRNPDPRGMALTYTGDLTLAQLMKRDTEHPDTYEREEISAMWFGFCLALKWDRDL